MTDRNFGRALPLVLKHEGGFVNHPSDPGGATNKGVTIATFRAYVKPDATVADLKKITAEQVSTVYYRHYWSAANCQALPSGVDYAVFDFAVNSGPRRAVEVLQKILKVPVDGKLGPKTAAAAEATDARDLVALYCDTRLAWLKGLKRGAMWKTFGKGWGRRVAEVRAAAIGMVGKPADVRKIEVPVEVDKPVVPKTVETAVQRRTGWLTWLTGGAGGSLLLWLREADWQTLAITAGGVVAAMAVVIVGGVQLVRRIKTIRAEISA